MFIKHIFYNVLTTTIQYIQGFTQDDLGQMMHTLDVTDVAFPNGSLDTQQLTGQSRGTSATFFYQVSSSVWFPSRSVFSGVVEAEEYVLFFA